MAVMTGLSTGEAVLEQALEQVDEALYMEGPRPRIAAVCRTTGGLATTMRGEYRRAGGQPATVRRLRLQANRFVKRWGHDLLSGRHHLRPAEIDLVVGCLARLEHAVGGGVPAMNGVRARAMRLLDALSQGEAMVARRRVPGRLPIPRFVVGEIKAHTPHGIRQGLRDLNRRGNLLGNEALVTYDRKGNVWMQVRRAGGDQRLVWKGKVGTVPKGQIPTAAFGSNAFGNLIEDPIVNLLERRTGQAFKHKHPNATGPDLVPILLPRR